MVRYEGLFTIYAASLISRVTGNEYEPASLIASSNGASSRSQLGWSGNPAIVPLDNEKSRQEGQEESHFGMFDLQTSKGQEGVLNQLTKVDLSSQAGGTLTDDISKPENSFDAELAVGLTVTATINFYTDFEPLLRAGQDFGAIMQVTGRSGSLLGSFNDVLYFVFVRLDDTGDAASNHKAKDPIFSGSTSVQASNGKFFTFNCSSIALPLTSRMACRGLRIKLNSEKSHSWWASVSNWRILKTGVYQIKIMCDGCAPALSPPLHVVSGEPFFLRLLQQPANSRSGEFLSVSPIIEATDAFGNPVLDLDGEVFVSLVPGTIRVSRARERNIAAVMMMGPFTRSFTDGRIEFSGLSIGAAGFGHRLHFSLLSPVTARAVDAYSEPFNVEAGSPAGLIFIQQPPDEITAGSFFTVEVRLVDSYGNAATGPHIIKLTAWSDTSSRQLLGTVTAETNADSGLVTFHEVAFQSGKGEYFIQAACMTCETKAIGRSHSTSVQTSSYVLVTSCTLLREGSADGGDQCAVTIALESLSHQWPRESVFVRIAEVERVNLRGGSGEPPLEIVPESLSLNPVEGLYSGEFIIKATDDTSLRYSTDSSDVQSGLFIQHYRVHLQVESLDIFWNNDAVEFLDKKYITIKVVDDDKRPLVFSSLNEGPIVLQRGDSISYGVSLGFSPISPIEVTVESAVGVTTQPRTLQFDEGNWAVVQPVTVHVTENLPAAPFVAPQSLPWSLTVSKISVGHQVKGDQSFADDVGKEELIFFVVEESMPLVVWRDTPRAVLAGESLDLPFVLSTQPVEAVSVTLECSELFDPSTQMVTLTPQQWRRGATFRLRATDDGEFSKPSTHETCAVTLTSGDQRFNFSREDFAEPADQSFGGYKVEVLVYKQYCADGNYRSNCPCLPGQQCGGSRQIQCSAGTYRHTALRYLTSLSAIRRLPGTTACLQCPEKHSCLEGSRRPQPCPDGSTAAAGSAACHLCAARECTFDRGLGCPAGRYSSSGTCLDCPEGFFCPLEGLAKPQPCPPGTYSSQASVTCTECPSGSFCPTGSFGDMQTCPSGTYSGVGSTFCSPCPAGYQCSTNVQANLLTPCGPGEYSEEASCSCLPCPRNFACPTPLKKVACEPVTQFAPPGQQVCRPCPNGFSCEGEEPIACPPGFDSFEGVGQCVEAKPAPTTVFGLQLREIKPTRADPECPEGRFYQGSGCFPYGPLGQCGHTTCFQCPRGYYCPAGAVAPLLLEEGFYALEGGLETVNQAIKCPRGAVCAAGSTTYQVCDSFEICPGYGAGKVKCPLGTIFLTAQAVNDQSACMTCPAAHYCPDPYEPPIPCPLGTYSKTDGSASKDACIIFPPGFVPTIEADLFVLSRRSPELFPTGWGGKKIPCSIGYFSRVQLGTSALHCEPCPARMMCDNETNEVFVCPKGHFCPTGTATGKERPCLPGTYSPSTSLADSGECISCLPGYYCPQGSSHQIKCPRGSYCPKRTASPGHYPCPGGTYNNEEMAIDIVQCLPCPSGKYCPEGTATPLSCPDGTYSDGYGTKLPGPGSHRTMCMFCPSGYSCSGGKRKACGKGRTSKEGDGTCMPCPKGFYCPLDVTTYDMLEQFSCPAGVLCSTEGLKSVEGGEPCPAGHYCPQGIPEAIKCPSGTYNPLKRRTTLSDCITSKAGTYAIAGTTTAEGTGKCQQVRWLLPCARRRIMIRTEFSVLHVLQGYFCPSGSSEPTQVACPAQTYNPSEGGKSSRDCLPCPAGFYCGSATTQPEPCPTGHYCPLESSEARPCPVGTFRASTGAAAEQECSLCPVGRYCATSGITEPTGLCAAGTLCLEGASNAAPRDGLTGIICPAYGYCPQGATHVEACPAGQFNPYEGGTSQSDCRECFPGYYCTVENGEPVVGRCDPGYTCPEGSTMPKQEIAPAGSFAPAGSAIAEFCPPGTHAPQEGSASCDLCPAGYYCDEAGMGSSKKTAKGCRRGMYCPEGSILHRLCPVGTYNPEYLGKSIDDCLPCPPGKYCQKEELETPSGDCAAGYYCARRSISIAPIEMDSFGNGPCPAGSYCPEGTANPVPCRPGTYQPSTHASKRDDCLECPAGWFVYCEHEGLKAPGAKCPAGYYCEEGKTEEGEAEDKLCPKGHMCPSGSAMPVPCLPGTYQDLAGRASCNVCGAGFYCLKGAEDGFDKRHQCPEGSFCPTGTKSGKEFLCPPGFYNPKKGIASVLSCLPCSSGHYCDQAGLAKPTGKCAAGFYCIAGARYPNEVLEGCVYDSGVPGRALGNCPTAPDRVADKSEAESLCSSILECVGIEEHGSSYHIVCGNVDVPEGGTQSIFFPKLCVKAGLCPLGKVCPSGTSTPEECPLGKFCASKGLKEPSGDCHEGFFCGGGATEPASAQNACAPGHYCPRGTEELRPCPQGTFLSASGAWNEDQCQACPPGRFCALPGLAAPSGVCSIGFFCTSKSTSPGDAASICPEGKYCPEGTGDPIPCEGGTYQSQQGEGSCKTCPEGSYCPSGSSTPRTCPVGFYCPAGTHYEFQYPCPQGTYGKTEGAKAVSSCEPCKEGHLCSSPGTGAVGKNTMTKCPPGYYCAEGKSLTPRTCTYGEYCPEKSASPMPCPPSFYCANEALEWPTGRCRGGYLCKQRATTHSPESATSGKSCPENSEGYPCPMGYYCHGELLMETPCPDGTFLNSEGGSTEEDCILCPAGYACQGQGQANITARCSDGYYCPEGSSSVTEVPCPPGYFCKAEAAATPCPRGWYQELQAQAACKMCTEGFYCDDSSVTPTSKCPPGHYCPKGTFNKHQHPCPLGTYRHTEGAKSSSECMACPAGKYCGSRGLTDPSGDCFAGFYCEGRAWSPAPSEFEKNPDGDFPSSGRLCPSGYYCEQGTKSPTLCPDGTSSFAPGSKKASDCQDCLPGNYCSNSVGTGPCAEGYYCRAGSSMPTPSDDKGSSCPEGYYCPEGSYTPQPCPPGTFSEGGKGKCTPCTLGWYCPASKLDSPKSLCKAGHACPEGAVYPIPCPPGTLAAGQGSSACELCSGGFVCDEAGLATPSGACPGGFVCVRGARTDTLPLHVFGDEHTDFGLCPAGHFCPANSVSPTPCAPGTYQDGVGALECKPCSPGFACTEYGLSSPHLPCDAGFYCIKGSATLRPTDGFTGDRCPAGWHCPAGSFTPQACPPGEYTTGPGQATCKTCPAGYECSLSSSIPSPCSDGLVCPEGSMRGFRCPLGSYKKTSDSSTPEKGCAPCPRGKYCRAGVIAGPCTAGFLCALGNSVPNPNYAEFPRSPYFPVGVEGSGSAVWLTEGNWKTSLEKSYGGIPCPAGYYCAEGEPEPSTCSRGTFRLEKGGRWPSDCSVCPPGYYCLPTTAEPVPCPTGHYCSRGTQTPSACPKRYYNPVGKQSSPSSCILCPAGMVCATEGISELGDEHICPEGHYCTQGSSSAIPCPAGTYNPHKGSVSSSDCQPCPGGILCGDTGTSSLSIPCPRGYYCPANSKGPLPCDPGSYCPEGCAEPSVCLGGYLCPAMSAQPQACPQGFYCPKGTAFALACPAGSRTNPYDFLRDSENSACETCPAGTYSAVQGSADCTPCEAGYICHEGCNQMFPQSIASNRGMPCQPGYYCPQGSSTMTPCPAGTYNPASARTSIDDCQKCPVGSYTNLMGQSSCIACGGSTYTEVGSFECKCSGANRVYQASSGACVCRKGYERIVAGKLEAKEQCLSSEADTALLRVRCEADEKIHGYFGVSGDLVAAMSERLVARTHEGPHFANRESFNLLASSYTSESPYRDELASVQSPVLCIMVGSTVLWELKPGDKPLYPRYLADSVLNTIDNFDADSFRELQIEMESGAPLLLFGHTFTASGIVVFAVNTNVNSIAVIYVVDDGKQCGPISLNTPHPLTDKILEALPIAISDMSFLGTPSWTVPCTIFVFVMLFIAAIIVLQSLVRNRYWTFAPPPRVEEDDEATEELYLSQNTKAQQSILCCKGALEEEPDLEDTLNDLDPRVFQAVYWKLLDSMAMVKDQLDHLQMHQDKLIELGIDIAPPLKASILPTLAEASEKKSRAEAEDTELSKRLIDFKNLMLLRKNALEEAVQKACEALKKETNDDEALLSKWSSGSALEDLQKTTQQASRALAQVATLNPQAFATVIGVEQSIATADALKRLQTAEAAAHSMRELIAETSHTEDQQGTQNVLIIINSRMKQKLDVSSSGTEALISDQRSLYEARRSISLMLSGLLHQRNEILMQQQISREELVVREIGELSTAVATLLEALYERFISARRDVEKAISNGQQASRPLLQKQFEEVAEDIYNEFTKKQQEAEARRQQQARERSSEFAKVVQDFLMQCRKSFDEAEREIFKAEELLGSRRESLEVQILQAYHSALLHARADQLAYLHTLQRKLVADKARNDCLARMHLEIGSTQRLSEEYKAETDQQLKALAAEQEAALADLKAAMDSECTRIMRIHKSRARIIGSFGQDERRKSSIWHKTKFRVLTDEVPCFISAQTKLEEASTQQLKRLRQRLVLEAEEFLTKLKLILKMPGSVQATAELQQCLDVCNRKIRCASESAAHSLTSLHKTMINSVVQEVRIARSSLIRAMELDEEELAQRYTALRAQQQEVDKEGESFHRSFCAHITEKDLEVEFELKLVRQKLAIERIRLQFIEDERDAFSSSVSELKEAALGKSHKNALQEVIKGLKAESSARFQELEAKLEEQIKRRGQELEEEQEESRSLALKRIAAAVEAQEKCTDWVGRQYSEITEVAKRQQRQVLQMTFQISDQLFSSLLGVTLDADSSVALQRGDEALADLSQKGLYFFTLLSLLPTMAPPSVPPPERRQLLNDLAKKREHTVKAINQERTKLLGSRLRHAKTRQDRLSAAEDVMRDNLAKARESEWMSTLLENAAVVEDSLVLTGRGQPSGWARSYCASVEQITEKHLKELEEKQAAELAAFEADAKEEVEKGELEIKTLQDKVDHILDQGPLSAHFTVTQDDAAQKTKEREERRMLLLEAQKKARLNEELRKQREFLEAQWRISRTVEFEALRSLQGDSFGVTEAEKELLVKCQETELRDLKELLNRQRLLILNSQRHESQKQAERKFHLPEVLLGDLSVLDGAPKGPWTEESVAAARRQVSQEVQVCKQSPDLLRKIVAQLAMDEENQIADLKARHYSQLAEVCKKWIEQGLSTLNKIVQLPPSPHEEDEEKAAASKSRSHPTDAPEPSTSKQVAEWQERMRWGSCASVFLSGGGVSGDHSKAFFKQLETFASLVAKTQREERHRQHLIMQGKLEGRAERQLARGKRKKGSIGAKRQKNIGPRKSIMDIKFARIQAEKQKEQQMRAKVKAEKNALDKWHPIFWNIIEEEANNGSYDDYEGTKEITARGPILRNIERIVASLEEGSFLRTMAANLELLAQACVSLGAAGGDAVLERERSEIDRSFEASSGDDDDESKLQPAKPEVVQKRRGSKESEASSSEETESIEEEESSSEEESDNDLESSEEESSQEGIPSVSLTSMQQVPEARGEAADQTQTKQKQPTLKEQVSRSSSDLSSSSATLSSRSVELADQRKSSSSNESSADTSESEEDSGSGTENSAAPSSKQSEQRSQPTGQKQESSSSSSSGSSISSSSSLGSSASLSPPTSRQTQERLPEIQPSSSSSSSSGTNEGQGGEQPSRRSSSSNSEDDSSSSSSVSEGTD
ncbi:hypothetical protein Esti_005101 [Eimeria stiedai]